MRLVSWNCNGALHRKWTALMALEPDLAIIQECVAPDRLAQSIRDFDPDRCLWTGRIPAKGLAVFAFGPWRLEPRSAPLVDVRFLLPVHVVGPAKLDLLAVWSVHQSSDKRKASRGPVHRALDQLDDFFTGAPAFAAGDFNHHVRWDKPGYGFNHAGVVARLARMGLSSVYHESRQVEQGAEPEPTIYWRDRTIDGPTYHIDYVFAPSSLAASSCRMTVGSHADWVATGLSDHVPLIVDVDDDALLALATEMTGAVA